MSRSHGQRSSSVSGMPLCIFSTLASGWNASPSAKSQCMLTAMPLATVVLPDPATPMTTTMSGVCPDADASMPATLVISPEPRISANCPGPHVPAGALLR